jgi:hypothetical protein
MLWDIYTVETDTETGEQTFIFYEVYDYQQPNATPYGHCVELHLANGGDYVAVNHPY